MKFLTFAFVINFNFILKRIKVKENMGYNFNTVVAGTFYPFEENINGTIKYIEGGVWI